MIGALEDLIHSKELLGHEKDKEHLHDLSARKAAIDLDHRKPRDLSNDPGLGL